MFVVIHGSAISGSCVQGAPLSINKIEAKEAMMVTSRRRMSNQTRVERKELLRLVVVAAITYAAFSIFM